MGAKGHEVSPVVLLARVSAGHSSLWVILREPVGSFKHGDPPLPSLGRFQGLAFSVLVLSL